MAGNGHTPTPVQGVPEYPMPAIERSRSYGRRKTDRGWRRWLALAAKVAPVMAATCTLGWWLASRIVVTRTDWNQARQEDAEFKGYVRANLEALKNSVNAIQETHR